MANEITVLSGVTITKDPLRYISQPNSFQADMTGCKGPTPGAVTVAVLGTTISLAQLTTPGICVFKNLDDTNYVTYGIWDPETETFYPLGEILPGEVYVLRLSRSISAEYGTGTGTLVPDTNNLMFRADTAAVVVSVEAFEG